MFTGIYTLLGANKKLVARISKSEPLILKSKAQILCYMKTVLYRGAEKDRKLKVRFTLIYLVKKILRGSGRVSEARGEL